MTRVFIGQTTSKFDTWDYIGQASKFDTSGYIRQVIPDNGSNPSIESPILANHGGASNDAATQNTYAEQVVEVDMDTRESIVADTKIESMENQRGLPTEITSKRFHFHFITFTHLIGIFPCHLRTIDNCLV